MTLQPVISLTTDFGILDPFVGTMKGVIAGICPDANVIDVTHSVPSFDLLEGALAIWQAWRYFPTQTVHVIVVDPGVGSERLAVLARMGGHWFVAPDNGVLTLVEREARRNGGDARAWKIENPAYRLPARSSTFHGRDLFAPAAAHLAVQIERGVAAPETFGPEVEPLIQLPVPEPIRASDGSVEGVILKTDKFGNLLTNLTPQDLPSDRRNFLLEIDGHRITHFCQYFAEAEPGELVAILGSSGLLEIAMNRSSAQETTGIIAGTCLRLATRPSSD